MATSFSANMSRKWKGNSNFPGVIYSYFGLDLSGFRLASFRIRERVLRICVSREGSQNMFFILRPTFLVYNAEKTTVGLNGAPRVWAEKIYFVPKILMKQPHDCSY